MNQNQPVINDATATALREMHPDPFVQGAMFRLFMEAPGALDSGVYVAIATAQGHTPDQIMDRRRPLNPTRTTTAQED